MRKVKKYLGPIGNLNKRSRYCHPQNLAEQRGTGRRRSPQRGEGRREKGKKRKKESGEKGKRKERRKKRKKKKGKKKKRGGTAV